jgi:protein phosphatase
MLICPNCQFENADTNKFCQDCGTSLTQISCPECGTAVSFNLSHCPNCNALTGQVWLAVVSRLSIPSSTSELLPPFVNGTYLDAQQRYQILDPLVKETDLLTEIHLRVLDCQPFQKSPLQTSIDAIAALETSASEAAESAMSGTPTSNVDDLSSRSSSGALASADVSSSTTNLSLREMAIPASAVPYLELGCQFHQTLPEIHDAWQQEDWSIVLLEDFSSIPTLSDLLEAESDFSANAGVKAIEPSAFWLQNLHWMYEMAALWAALEPWQCCQSLLKPNNLKIDEDQVLHLQRLYSDTVEFSPKLQDLGYAWQVLLGQSQQTQWGDLALLLNDLQMGKILTIDELLVRIESTAHGLQAHSTPTVTMTENQGSESTSPSVNPSQAPNLIAKSFVDMSADTIEPDSTSSVVNPDEPELTDLDVALPTDDGEGDSDDTPTVVLPMQLSNLEYVGRTDIGRQRDHNEDYFGIQTRISRLESPSGRTVHARGVYVLCDGMGGHAGGEVASALAVDTLRQYFQTHWWDPQNEGSQKEQKLPPPDVIRDAIYRANEAIYDVNQQNARSGSGRMGTTLVMVLLHDTEVAVAHVGDSRLYRFTRKRGLEQITVDHEVGQREIQRGVDPEIAYGRPDAYQLTQALGPRDENFVSPDVQYLELNEDTLLLLCSDGLTDNNLLENHWKTHIEPLLSSQANLEQGASRLIELANQYNGHDNITALVIQAKVRPNLEQLRR